MDKHVSIRVSVVKITTPEDLQMETRIGTGYDVHRLTEDRKLILGGVEIPLNVFQLPLEASDWKSHGTLHQCRERAFRYRQEQQHLA